MSCVEYVDVHVRVCVCAHTRVCVYVCARAYMSVSTREPLNIALVSTLYNALQLHSRQSQIFKTP